MSYVVIQTTSLSRYPPTIFYPQAHREKDFRYISLSVIEGDQTTVLNENYGKPELKSKAVLPVFPTQLLSGSALSGLSAIIITHSLCRFIVTFLLFF